MKQYKYIYFLGQKFIQQSNNIIKSARQKVNDQLEIQNQSIINQQKNYHQTYNLQNSDQKSYEDHQFYKYQIGSHIAYRYQIINTINRGSFGQVIKVFDHKIKQFLALKIVKKGKDLLQQTFIQISILTHIKETDKANTSGIVRIKDFLFFRNHMCILFQLLDGNIYELLTSHNFKGFSEDIIRVFAIQILNSLLFLRKQKILHCDLKPENLVMNKWGKTGIKLIDFGTSCFQGKQMYSYLQSRYYRAPQVLMQMPYSYPIDMWSFGCIIAQLKLGEPLFSGRSSIQQLIYLISCIGMPNKTQGLFSLAFLQNEMFKQILKNNYLNNYKEQNLEFGSKTNNFKSHYNLNLKKNCLLSLQNRLIKFGNYNQQFFNFLQSILKWQPQKRLTPQQALRHPWITNGISSQIYSLCYSFHSNDSLSKSKKKSKDSKKDKKSRPKSDKNNNIQKVKFFKDQVIQRQKTNEQNKIKFHSQKLSSRQIDIKSKNSNQLVNFQSMGKQKIKNKNNQLNFINQNLRSNEALNQNINKIR